MQSGTDIQDYGSLEANQPVDLVEFLLINFQKKKCSFACAADEDRIHPQPPAPQLK